MRSFYIMTALTLGSSLTSLQVSAAPPAHMIRVTSDGLAAPCFVDPTTDGDQATGLRYVCGTEKAVTFGVDVLETGGTLYTSSGQPVVRIKLDKNFDPRSGGSAQMIMLREYNAFSANDYRALDLRVYRENGNWVTYSNYKGGLKPFDDIFLKKSKWGIKYIDLKSKSVPTERIALDTLVLHKD